MENSECFNETLNAKIRNKLTPLANVIGLMEFYKNSKTEDDKSHAIELIINSKKDLENILEWLIKIN